MPARPPLLVEFSSAMRSVLQQHWRAPHRVCHGGFCAARCSSRTASVWALAEALPVRKVRPVASGARGAGPPSRELPVCLIGWHSEANVLEPGGSYDARRNAESGRAGALHPGRLPVPRKLSGVAHQENGLERPAAPEGSGGRAGSGAHKGCGCMSYVD